MPKIGRRAFLSTGGAAAGAMLLGYVFTPRRLAQYPAAAAGRAWLTTWVGVNADNTITVLVPQAEMGQGVLTALPMMLAEEMEADWNLVRVETAPAEGFYVTDKIARGFTAGRVEAPFALRRLLDYSFYKISGVMDLQITGGSASVRFTGHWGMRHAGAAAKQMLLQAAARQWGVAVEECYAKLGRIRHDASGRYLNYGELAAAAAALPPPTRVALKARQDYTICGKSLPRIDIPAKVTGAQRYAIDARLPGMRYAAIRHAPVFGGEVASFDAAAIRAKPGVEEVLRIPGAVLVIANNYWRAAQALREVSIEFSDGENGGFSSAAMFAAFEKKLAGAPGGEPAGEVEIDLEQGRADDLSGEVIEATYQVPFLAHATMEPMNCTAHRHDGKLELWVGSQDPLGARVLAAKTAGMKMRDVRVHPMQLGGGFGRRVSFTGNFIEDAVHAALRVDYPVQLIWSREQDMQHDYYRPAGMSRFAAALDEAGNPRVWHNRYTDIGVSDNTAAAFPPYEIARQSIGRVKHETPVPVSYWRSVEHSCQGFFVESFIDELAHRAGVDPLQYRLRLLRQRPRYQAVLELAARKAAWGKPLPRGVGLGVAIVESFDTIVAEVARVRAVKTGAKMELKVEKVVAVADPGEVIHPATARAQIESGIVYGLTAALYNEITLEKGRVVQTNFPNYEMMKLADAPDLEAHFIESGGPPGGMGEVGVPPAAAALTNAVFAATGRRIRRLPLVKHL